MLDPTSDDAPLPQPGRPIVPHEVSSQPQRSAAPVLFQILMCVKNFSNLQ